MAEKKSFQDKVLPVMVVGLIGAAFALGVMWGKLQVYEKGNLAQNAGQPVTPTPVPVTIDQVKALFTEGNIVFGDANKKTLFVEFADPSCPWCHVASGKNLDLASQMLGSRFKDYVAAEPEMRKMVEQGEAGFVWLYRYGHGSGELAAQLLYCANEVGQFWAVHDLVMNAKGYKALNEVVGNDVANLPELMKLVSSLPQSNVMRDCVASGKYADRIAQDTATGDSLGAGGTPHFIVNTTVFPGATSWTEMKKAVGQQ